MLLLFCFCANLTQMKALLINGSSRAYGCTFTALNIAAEKERNDLPEDWKCPRCKQGKEKFNRA